MKRLMLAVGFAALAFSGMADVATFTIPSGETKTVDEAISAGYLSGVADYAGLLAASDLVVAGGGELRIDKDLRADGYDGEVHVVSGSTLALANAGALGDIAHGTFVADGATLAVMPTGDANTFSFAGERLSFAGEGVDGRGALVIRTSGAAQRNGCWGGTYLTMTGDARVGVLGGNNYMYDFPCNSSDNALDMNGHTLTLAGDGAAQYTLPVRFKVANPGHMIVSNRVYLSINNVANLGGSAENTLTIGANSCIDLYSCNNVGFRKWTLILASEQSGVLRATSGSGIWDGPVGQTSGTGMLVPVISASETVQPVLKFSSGFTTTNHVTVTNSTQNAAYTQPVLELSAAGNRFSQGLTLEQAGLKLGGPNALSMADGPLVLNDAPLTFSDPYLTYQLPSTVVNNKQAQGLTLAAEVSFGDLSVREGAMSLLRVEDRHWNAGLWKGTNQAYSAWAGGDHPANNTVDGFKSRLCWTNEPSFGPELAMKATTRSYDGVLTVVTYSGYIWNRDSSAASKVLTLRFGAKTLCYVWLHNGNMWCNMGQQGSNETGGSGVRLTPGAWPIEIRMVNLNGESFGPNGKFSEDYGIMYTWGSSTCTSTDPKDYLPLMDPGDGSLLTLTVPDTPEYEALRAKATAARQFAKSVTVDGSLDLGGANLSALTLSGTGTVVNEPLTYAAEAKLTVTDALALRKDDLVTGKGLSVQGKLAFGANAKVTLDKLHGVRNGTYEVLSSTEPIEGELALGALPEASFSLRFSDDRKTLYMDVCRGLTVILK